MSEVASKIVQAHKLAAGASGRMSIMLARGKLQLSAIDGINADLTASLKIIQTLMKKEGPKPWRK